MMTNTSPSTAPIVLNNNLCKPTISDFLKALGLTPVTVEGHIHTYYPSYGSTYGAVLEVDTASDTWRDTLTGEHGDIYQLASKDIGTSQKSYVLSYIASIMKAYARLHGNGLN